MNPIIIQEGGDILDSERFRRCSHVIHHKGTNVARHSLEVTEYALHLYEKKHRPETSVRDVVRVCLLHDIGMSDREIHDSISFIKAYAHPRRSAKIAREEYGANDLQIEAILHHMWPVCIMPPASEAGWLLLRADKYCSMGDVAGLLKHAVFTDDEIRKGDI